MWNMEKRCSRKKKKKKKNHCILSGFIFFSQQLLKNLFAHYVSHLSWKHIFILKSQIQGVQLCFKLEQVGFKRNNFPIRQSSLQISVQVHKVLPVNIRLSVDRLVCLFDCVSAFFLSCHLKYLLFFKNWNKF